jgi:hypothetical protein
VLRRRGGRAGRRRLRGRRLLRRGRAAGTPGQGREARGAAEQQPRRVGEPIGFILAPGKAPLPARPP